MVYRAKITKIQSWVESNYNINAHGLARDANDVYIEVKSADEANVLETMNFAQSILLDLQAVWVDKFYNDRT